MVLAHYMEEINVRGKWQGGLALVVISQWNNKMQEGQTQWMMHAWGTITSGDTELVSEHPAVMRSQNSKSEMRAWSKVLLPSMRPDYPSCLREVGLLVGVLLRLKVD